jgi:hypothetical protein
LEAADNTTISYQGTRLGGAATGLVEGRNTEIAGTASTIFSWFAAVGMIFA